MKRKNVDANLIGIIDDLVNGQEKNGFKCLAKYCAEYGYVTAIVLDKAEDEYFVLSQKNPEINGMIIDLSDDELNQIDGCIGFFELLQKLSLLKDEIENDYTSSICKKCSVEIRFDKEPLIAEIILLFENKLKSLHPSQH